MERWLALLVALAGCGRIGFDPSGLSPDGSRPALQLVRSDTHRLSGMSFQFSESIGEGDLVVVATNEIGQNAIASISDGVNSYVSAGAGVTGSCCASEIWYVANSQAVSNATITITLSMPPADMTEVWFAEFAGVATQNPSDGHGMASGTVTTALSGPTVTTTTSADVVIAVAVTINANLSVPAAPFVGFPNIVGDACAYTLTTAPGTYGGSWQVSGASEYTASIAAFAAGF